MARFLVLMALLLSISTSAFAQSAEETVAFILMEMEAGNRHLAQTNGATDGSLTELVTSSPALFRATGTGQGGKKETYFLEVNKINACRYSSRLYEGKPNKDDDYYIDMSFSTTREISNVSCISVEIGGPNALKATPCTADTGAGCDCSAQLPTGRCSNKDDKTCSAPVALSFDVSNMTRIKNALAHFRDNICKGRAF